MSPARPFFQRLQLQPVRVAFEDIVRADPKARAVYEDLIRDWPHFLNEAVRDSVESRLRPYRQRAWEGRLDTRDFGDLLHAFHAFKGFRNDRSMSPLEAYTMINCCAALLAQMLFVDNCVKEAVDRVSHPDNQETLTRLVHHIQETYREEKVPIQASEARFYASYFLIQTLFDKIFVSKEEEEPVRRDPATGKVQLTEKYDFYTSYLELSNSKLATASDVEKELCYQLTTGWGDGIDVDTWNELNQAYYQRSPDNFFSALYDEQLERMIPQFSYGRARAADDMIGAWDGVRPFHLVEIGAGSGAFAAELFGAFKSQQKDEARFFYRGLEPSEAMKGTFRENFQKRTGHEPPVGWEIETAGLEGFLEDPGRHLTHETANVLLFSYSAHHCYGPSLQRLIENAVLQKRVEAIYILDATAEHGWTKVYYMPLDCRSPEDFRNISLTGSWHSDTLWHEPFKLLEHHSISRAWCAFRRLTRPQG